MWGCFADTIRKTTPHLSLIMQISKELSIYPKITD
jgi:hypothetical protein